jgi:alcohol dehydrogenase
MVTVAFKNGGDYLMTDDIYTFNTPGTIKFGNNSLSQLSQVVTELSAKSICLVTDPGVSGTGILEKTLNVLAETAAGVIVFDAVEPEPDIRSIDRCAALAKGKGVDLFVGLGGGSPMDVLKGAAIVTKHGGSIFDYLGVDNVPGPTIKKILIPTTAGTGSEVTPFAIFKDKVKQLKTAIQSKFVMGDVVIVDPLLTLSCPPKVTAVCGMDAFTHAIESYTSINASPMSEQFSLQAIGLIGKHILSAYANGDNLDARKSMSLGSLYAGFGIANAGSGAVGALSYPVEGTYQVIHGVGNALLLPHVIAYNAVADFSKIEAMAEVLDLEYTSGRDATAAVVGFVKELNEIFRIPGKLIDIGAKKADIEAMADDAFTRQRILINNMRKLDHGDIIKIYESAW